MHLRIATCRPMPEPDADEEILLSALAARRIEARMAAWNDPREDWDAPLPTVIRSTWDYVLALPRFLEWAQRAERAGPLWNPLAVVRGNVHKRYLVELAARGVPTVPTALVERGSATRIAALARERGWSRLILKPAVGAASRGTKRFEAHELDLAQRHLDLLLAQGDALVQPYLDSVEGHGERALVCIDGELTHAVRKSPRFADGEECVSAELPIEKDERALADQVLALVPQGLLYARVDVARGADGKPQLMELELVEPSLFLRQSPKAQARLADALARRLA
jgi:glutathione synthase/RimK-type ligase-like ATP-grasp enzyme